MFAIGEKKIIKLNEKFLLVKFVFPKSYTRKQFHYQATDENADLNETIELQNTLLNKDETEIFESHT